MKEYTVSGPAGDYTVLLSDEDAKERGLKQSADASSKAKTPANKQATPANKSATAKQPEAK